MPTMVGRMVLYIPGWLFLGFTEPSSTAGFGFHVRFEEISLKQKTGPLVLGPDRKGGELGGILKLPKRKVGIVMFWKVSYIVN